MNKLKSIAKEASKYTRQKCLRHFGVEMGRTDMEVNPSNDRVLEIKVSGTSLPYDQSKIYSNAFTRWSRKLAVLGYKLKYDKSEERLTIEKRNKRVHLPAVHTITEYLGAVINHWDSISVNNDDEIHSIAGVEIKNTHARYKYKGVWLEYGIESNWASESLEEILFFADLLPNYYSHEGPPDGGIIFDLGAYHGLFSLAASVDVGPSGKVFAFEPDTASCDIIKKNQTSNERSNIEVINLGMWSKTGKMNFSSNGDLSSKIEKSGNGTIEVISLSDACKMLKLNAPNFIKADIEGAEIEVVNSEIHWINSLQETDFSIASYHIVDGQQTKDALHKLFSGIGYKVRTTKYGHQTTIAWR
jgi:FkbM family methyltransferase